MWFHLRSHQNQQMHRGRKGILGCLVLEAWQDARQLRDEEFLLWGKENVLELHSGDWLHNLVNISITELQALHCTRVKEKIHCSKHCAQWNVIMLKKIRQERKQGNKVLGGDKRASLPQCLPSAQPECNQAAEWVHTCGYYWYLVPYLMKLCLAISIKEKCSDLLS